jgi:hypothetical protein
MTEGPGAGAGRIVAAEHASCPVLVIHGDVIHGDVIHGDVIHGDIIHGDIIHGDIIHGDQAPSA